MSIRRFFGSKSFYKHVVIIAIPLIFQQLISNSVNLMVNLMIGQLGDHALAGVATVNRFFLIATFGTSGVIGAAAVFMAQFYGADDHEGMKQTFRYTIWAATIIMSLFLVIGVMFPTQIIGFFVNDPNVIREGLNFIYIGSLAFIPNIVTLSIAGSMRATGDSKTPLAAGIVSVIVNAFFNYGLIYGNFGFPAMGVTGAAIGTLIARTAELVFISYFFIRGDYPFKTKIADMFTMSTDIIKRISSKALPLVSNEILWATGMALLLRFYASRGPEVISGYSIASTVSDMFFTMNAGMSIAITILVSQPLGAGNFDEARDNGYHLIGFGVILSAIFGVLLFVTTFFIPAIYSVSNEAMWTAQTFLRIQSPLFSIYVMNTTCYFILRAGGDMRSTLMLDSGYMWCVNLVAVGLATYFTPWGIIGLYLVGQSTDIFKMMVAFRFVRKEKWLTNLAAEETPIDLEFELT